jgi:hypothetical protein
MAKSKDKEFLERLLQAAKCYGMNVPGEYPAIENFIRYCYKEYGYEEPSAEEIARYRHGEKQSAVKK